uniref:Uncharacterized protein n=1 Tax=Arundo donax TaxID=35708 RepID=A0A0A9FH75_ARUDO
MCIEAFSSCNLLIIAIASLAATAEALRSASSSL